MAGRIETESGVIVIGEPEDPAARDRRAKALEEQIKHRFESGIRRLTRDGMPLDLDAGDLAKSEEDLERKVRGGMEARMRRILLEHADE